MDVLTAPEYEYTFIEFCERLHLIAEVQRRLQAGWHCQGGIAIAVDPGGKFPMVYAQAMVRERPLPELTAESVAQAESVDEFTKVPDLDLVAELQQMAGIVDTFIIETRQMVGRGRVVSSSLPE